MDKCLVTYEVILPGRSKYSKSNVWQWEAKYLPGIALEEVCVRGITQLAGQVWILDLESKSKSLVSLLHGTFLVTLQSVKMWNLTSGQYNSNDKECLGAGKEYIRNKQDHGFLGPLSCIFLLLSTNKLTSSLLNKCTTLLILNQFYIFALSCIPQLHLVRKSCPPHK